MGDMTWFSEWVRFEDVKVVKSSQPLILEVPATGKAARLRGPDYKVSTLTTTKAVLFSGKMTWYKPGPKTLGAWLELLNTSQDMDLVFIELLREWGPLGLYYIDMAGVVDFDRDKYGRRVDVIQTVSQQLLGRMHNPDYWSMFHRDRREPRRLELAADDVFSKYLEPLSLLHEQVKAFKQRLSTGTVLEPVVTKPVLRGSPGRTRWEFMYRSLLDYLYIATAESLVDGATIGECAYCGGRFLKGDTHVAYCSDKCRDNKKADYVREYQKSDLQKYKMKLRARLITRRRSKVIKSNEEVRYRDLVNEARTIKDLEKLEQRHPVLRPLR